MDHYRSALKQATICELASFASEATEARIRSSGPRRVPAGYQATLIRKARNIPVKIKRGLDGARPKQERRALHAPIPAELTIYTVFSALRLSFDSGKSTPAPASLAGVRDFEIVDEQAFDIAGLDVNGVRRDFEQHEAELLGV